MAEHLRERRLPETEEWAARLLFRHALKDLEKSFEIVSVPMRQACDEKGLFSWKRPDTRDTLRAFFRQWGDRKLNSLLAISLNPFVSYQHAVGLSTWGEEDEQRNLPARDEPVGLKKEKELLKPAASVEAVDLKGRGETDESAWGEEKTAEFSRKADEFSQKSLETVGPLHPRFGQARWKSDEERLIAILLDNFARCAHEELGILRKKGGNLC
jgi:hypothetical protein